MGKRPAAKRERCERADRQTFAALQPRADRGSHTQSLGTSHHRVAFLARDVGVNAGTRRKKSLLDEAKPEDGRNGKPDDSSKHEEMTRGILGIVVCSCFGSFLCFVVFIQWPVVVFYVKHFCCVYL